MVEFTGRLKLAKPAVAGEVVDIAIFNANMDKIDEMINAFVCTSTTRPAAPYPGQFIYESDTKIIYMWSGTQWMYFGGASLGDAGEGGLWHNKTVSKGTWKANVRRVRLNESFLLLSGYFYYDSATGTSFPASASFNSIVDGYTTAPTEYPDWAKTGAGQSSMGTVMGVGVISGGGENAHYHYSIDHTGGVSARVQATLTVTSTKLFSFGPVYLFKVG